MPPTFKSLLLKEFHEQKWRVLSLTTIYIAVMLYAFTLDDNGRPPQAYSMLMVCHLFFGSIFIAMSVIASEHSNATFNFTRALPIHPNKIITAKILAALASISIPILVITAITTVWVLLDDVTTNELRYLSKGYRNDPLLLQVAITCLIHILTAWIMTIWCIAIAITQRTELKVGMTIIISLSIMFASLTGLFFIFENNPGETTAWIAQWIFGASPFGFMGDRDFPLDSLFSQAIVITALITYTLHRYASEPKQKTQPQQAANTKQTIKIPQPFTSTFNALFWQQTRVARPVICGAIVIFIAMTSIFLSAESLELQARNIATPTSSIIITADGTRTRFFTPEQLNLIRRQNKLYNAAESRLKLANTLSMFPPLLLAIVVGVALFAGDLRDNQLAFWRSRPISPATWLFIRYTIGAAAIVLAIFGPGLLTHAFYTPTQDYNNYLHTQYIRTLITMPLLQLGTYTATVLITIIIRQPIYAGILSLGVMLFFIINPYLGLLSKQTQIAQNIFFQFLFRDSTNFFNTPSQHWPFFLIWFSAIGIMAIATYLLIRRPAALEHWLR